MLLFPDSFHSTSLDLDDWGMAQGSGVGLEFQNQCETLNATCKWDLYFWQTGANSPFLPLVSSGIQLSLLPVLVEWRRRYRFEMEMDSEVARYHSAIPVIECLSASGMLAILLLSQRALHAD